MAHPDGGAHCTWHAEPLGHVTLDELMETEGIVDHRGSTGLNQREYKSCFWDERHDAQRNRERDFSRGKAGHFILMGIGFTAAFVITIVLVVKLVLAQLT